MSQYLYRPLDVAKGEIRLLVLQPGEGDSIVEVEIIYEYLDDKPSYEALSYVWGDPTVTEDLHILAGPQATGSVPSTQRQQTSQDATVTSDVLHFYPGDKLAPLGDSSPGVRRSAYIFKATTNLESALRHLRFFDEPRLLWVDAICINQQDDTERGDQVRQMGQIYQMCSRVCIWLGEAADDSDLAMELMDSIENSSMLASLKSADGKFTFRDSFVPAARRYVEDEQFVTHFRALLSLIFRPWFNRLWIVQEVVSASARTVFCGTKTAEWSLVFRTFLFLFANGLSKSKLENSVRNNWETIFQYLPEEINSKWRDAIEGFIRLCNMTFNRSEESPSLRELLLKLRGREMTDKRDAVYALLSLAGDVSPKDWSVNYAMTPIEVFKATVKREIETSRCLDIICDGPACSHGNYIFPSWLPRFDAEELPCGCSSFQGSILTFRDVESVSDRRASLYDASRGHTARVVINEQGNELTTDGVLVDCIGSVMQRPLWTKIPGAVPDLIIPNQWFSVALGSECPRNLQPGQEDAEHYELHPKKFDALWRTMIANRIPPSNGPAPLLFGEGLRNWLEHEWGDLTVSAEEAFHPDKHLGFENFKARVYESVRHNETLVITEQGSLGLAKGNVAPGDQVCVLLGCSVPMILRRVADVEREEYILIGESYIHEMMDGEAVDKLDTGEYNLKGITIV